MKWETVPVRTDVQRVAGDLATLTQASLSTAPNIAWVEREELNLLMHEVELSTSGMLDIRSALRAGRMSRAQILITGQLNAEDHQNTFLRLQAIDLDRGDILSSTVTPLPKRPHKHWLLRPEDGAVATEAVQEIVDKAKVRRDELSNIPAVALLFIANSGPSSRLDFARERLERELRSSGTRAGGRVSDFPGGQAQAEEHLLAVLGLVEADPVAWSGIADLYVWGELREYPSDGVAFEDTPVEYSMTLWDGSSAPTVTNWKGIVSDMREAERLFGDVLSKAVRPGDARSTDARIEAARLLAAHEREFAGTLGDEVHSREFRASEAGKNAHEYRVHLLQTAVFLDPADAALRWRLYDARWLSGIEHSSDDLWRRYEELYELTTRFHADRDASTSPRDPIYARVAMLNEIVGRLHEERLENPGHRIDYVQVERACRLWPDELRAYLSHQQALHARFAETRSRLSEHLQGPRNGPDFLSTGGLAEGMIRTVYEVTGSGPARELIESTWPMIAPDVKAMLRDSSDDVPQFVIDLVHIYQDFGEEGKILQRLNDLMGPVQSALPSGVSREFLQAEVNELIAEFDGQAVVAGWQHGVTPSGSYLYMNLKLPDEFILTEDDDRCIREHFSDTYSRVVVRNWAPANASPPIVGPSWGSAEFNSTVISTTTDFGNSLPLDARPMIYWATPSTRGTTSSMRFNLPPNAIRLLGFDQRRLWIAGLPVGPGGQDSANTELRREHALSALLPDTREINGLGSLLQLKGQALGVLSRKDTLFVATEFDGILKLGPDSQSIRRITIEDGLPAAKLASVALFDGGLVAAAAPPEQGMARYSFETEQWITLSRPLGEGGDAVPARTGARTHPGAVSVMVGMNRWLLACSPHPTIFDAEKGTWSRALPDHRASAQPRDWSFEPVQAAVGDGDFFWLGGNFGLVQFDPKRPVAEARWEKSPPILAIADAGSHLWIAFASETPAENPWDSREGGDDGIAEPSVSKLALFDKSNFEWKGSIEVPGVITSVAAGPGFLWAAGSVFYEFDAMKLNLPLFAAGGDALSEDLVAKWLKQPQLPIQQSLWNRDLDTVKVLLKAGEPVNATGPRGWSALHIAARLGWKEAATTLLDAGADLSLLTRDGRSALGIAAGSGNRNLVKFLLDAGADPNQQGRQHLPRLTPLVNALGANQSDPPPQPTDSSVELLSDGRRLVRWRFSPTHSSEVTIYRNDSNVRSPIHYRHGAHVANAVDIGRIVALEGPGANSWIDYEPLAPGVTVTYSVVATNEHHLTGPLDPPPAGSVTIPSAPEPGVLFLEVHPADFDPVALHEAAAAGHLDIVELLLNSGADPAIVNAGGATALHMAIANRHSKVAYALVEQGTPLNIISGPDLNFVDYAFGIRKGMSAFRRNTHTPLSLAYETRHDRDLFLHLLDRGADPTASPRGALAPYAAGLGREEDVSILLNFGPHPFVTDDRKDTPFVAALRERRFDLARNLREHSYNPGHPAWPKNSELVERAIMVAIRVHDEESLLWLIEQGVDLSSFRSGMPLEIAIETRAPASLVELLIDHGAILGQRRHDVAKMLPEIRGTELHEILSNLLDATATHVPRAKPDADFTIRIPVFMDDLVRSPRHRSNGEYRTLHANQSAETAAQSRKLLEAAKAGHVREVVEALAAGAEVDATDDRDFTPLMLALREGNADAVRSLIDAGSFLNARNSQNLAPLVLAAQFAPLELIDEMIDLGADPNLTFHRRRTPLLTALIRDPAIGQRLLERGADPSFSTYHGGFARYVPPLFIAAQAGRLDVIRLLVDHGADPASILWRGLDRGFLAPAVSAVHFGAASNDLPTLEYFLSLGLDPALEGPYGHNALDFALEANALLTADHLRRMGLTSRTERGYFPAASAP